MHSGIHLTRAAPALFAIGCAIVGQSPVPQTPPAAAAQAPVQEPQQRARPADAKALFRMFAATQGLEARFEPTTLTAPDVACN